MGQAVRADGGAMNGKLTAIKQCAKTEREIAVITRFCAWYAGDHVVRCDFIRLGDSNKGEPDAFICVGEKETAVELARYRELGPHNEKLHCDEVLKKAIFDAGINDSSLSGFRPDIRYRGTDARDYHFPRPTERQAFKLELFNLLRRFGTATDSSREVRFSDPTSIESKRRHDRQRTYVANEEYPQLSAYLGGVVIHPNPGKCMGYPRSSMNSRFTHNDFESVTETVRKKLTKLPNYRRAVGSLPVWLLYYSEGNVCTGRLAGLDYNERVVDHIRGLCSQSVDQFDAIWWADCVFASDGPAIFSVK
jgi:hypothetical protein